MSEIVKARQTTPAYYRNEFSCGDYFVSTHKNGLWIAPLPASARRRALLEARPEFWPHNLVGLALIGAGLGWELSGTAWGMLPGLALGGVEHWRVSNKERRQDRAIQELGTRSLWHFPYTDLEVNVPSKALFDANGRAADSGGVPFTKAILDSVRGQTGISVRRVKGGRLQGSINPAAAVGYMLREAAEWGVGEEFLDKSSTSLAGLSRAADRLSANPDKLAPEFVQYHQGRQRQLLHNALGTSATFLTGLREQLASRLQGFAEVERSDLELGGYFAEGEHTEPCLPELLLDPEQPFTLQQIRDYDAALPRM